MKTLKISLNSIDKVKAFVNEISKFDCDFDLVSGRYVIDAHEKLFLFLPISFLFTESQLLLYLPVPLPSADRSFRLIFLQICESPSDLVL